MRRALAVMLLALLCTRPATAQQAQSEFSPENAIVDTSIPFAIGAREAQQELRGPFGWQTYQEGLVAGVYFRFDPDGYARFSPSPRLDSDMFEVVCRPRTRLCEGRKPPLRLTLTPQKQLQIVVEGVAQGDELYATDGITEIRLPDRVLEPLDTRLEALLGASSELIVRRGGQEFARVSLKGFTAVASYLRWVAAGQDYTVLPNDWPVPGSGRDGIITKPVTWNSPTPQPQRAATAPQAPAPFPPAGPAQPGGATWPTAQPAGPQGTVTGYPGPAPAGLPAGYPSAPPATAPATGLAAYGAGPAGTTPHPWPGQVNPAQAAGTMPPAGMAYGASGQGNPSQPGWPTAQTPPAPTTAGMAPPASGPASAPPAAAGATAEAGTQAVLQQLNRLRQELAALKRAQAPAQMQPLPGTAAETPAGQAVDATPSAAAAAPGMTLADHSTSAPPASVDSPSADTLAARLQTGLGLDPQVARLLAARLASGDAGASAALTPEAARPDASEAAADTVPAAEARAGSAALMDATAKPETPATADPGDRNAQLIEEILAELSRDLPQGSSGGAPAAPAEGAAAAGPADLGGEEFRPLTEYFLSVFGANAS